MTNSQSGSYGGFGVGPTYTCSECGFGTFAYSEWMKHKQSGCSYTGKDN